MSLMSPPERVTSQSALKSSYEQGKFTNVTFILNDEQGNRFELRAHKCVLASRSPVFENWFYTRIPKKNNLYTLDDKPDEFRPFLDYLYNEELESATLTNVFKMAVKYQVALDIDDFRACLCRHNTLALFEVARSLGNEYDGFLNAIKQKILKNLTTMINATSPGFLHLSEQSVTEILNFPNLNISTQNVLDALSAWSTFQCGVQNKQVIPEHKYELIQGILENSTALSSRLQEMNDEEFDKFVDSGNYDADAIPPDALSQLRNKFFVKIKHINGTITQLENVGPTTTVGMLKAVLQQSYGVPIDRLRLGYNQEPLANKKTLADYSIGDGAEITCVYSL